MSPAGRHSRGALLRIAVVTALALAARAPAAVADTPAPPRWDEGPQASALMETPGVATEAALDGFTQVEKGNVRRRATETVRDHATARMRDRLAPTARVNLGFDPTNFLVRWSVIGGGSDRGRPARLALDAAPSGLTPAKPTGAIRRVRPRNTDGTWSLWIQGRRRSLGAPDSTEHSYDVLAGADLLMSEIGLVGLALGLESYEADDPDAPGARGFALGPYTALRLPHGFLLGLWTGSTLASREINGSLPGGQPGSLYPFVSANLSGDWRWHGFRFAPRADAFYGHVGANWNADVLGHATALQLAPLGRLNFGPEISYRAALGPDGEDVLEPFVFLRGEYDFAPRDPAFAALHGAFGARLGFGGRVVLADDLDIRLEGVYHGLGRPTAQAWTGRAQITRRF